jgi:hypothetical protein
MCNVLLSAGVNPIAVKNEHILHVSGGMVNILGGGSMDYSE